MADEVKVAITPVWKKSEFWVSMVTNVVGILLAFEVVTPEQSSRLCAGAAPLVGAVMTLLSSLKLMGVQHSSKVEAFRAMCAMQIEAQAKPGQAGVASAMSSGSAGRQVASLAAAVRL